MGAAGTKVLFLSKQEVDGLLTHPETAAAVERVFLADGLGQVRIPPKEVMPMGGKNALFAMPGCDYALGVAGVKWTNFYPGHPRGLPTCWSHVLVLSRVEDGQPYAILDATGITARRTAAGHGVVAAKYLARPEPRVLGIVGCGVQGCAAMQAFPLAFPLECIKVFASPRSLARARSVLESCAVPVRPVSSMEALAEGCDIILTATTSETPLLRAGLVPEGCFVDAMYAFHDVDPALSRTADKWVLGQWDADRPEILEDPDTAGAVDARDVYGTLGEIVCGKKPGRRRPEERIVFTHMGMAALDIAVADLAVQKARAQGVGQLLQLN